MPRRASIRHRAGPADGRPPRAPAPAAVIRRTSTAGRVSRWTTRPSLSASIVNSSGPPRMAARSAIIPSPEPGDQRAGRLRPRAQRAGRHVRPIASAGRAAPRATPPKSGHDLLRAGMFDGIAQTLAQGVQHQRGDLRGQPAGRPRWLHHTGTPLAAVKVRPSATRARSSPRPSGIRHRSARVARSSDAGSAGNRLDLGQAVGQRADRCSPRERWASTPTENSVCAMESCNRPAIAWRCRSAASSAWLALIARWCRAVPASAASPSSRPRRYRRGWRWCGPRHTAGRRRHPGR